MVSAIVKAIIFCVVANKNDTLTGNFGFVGNKMAFTIGKLTEFQSHFITYKSNENTTDLTTKLIKQLTRTFLKTMITVMLPMKWRTLLKTVAKDCVFVAGVMRWELQKCCPGATG